MTPRRREQHRGETPTGVSPLIVCLNDPGSSAVSSPGLQKYIVLRSFQGERPRFSDCWYCLGVIPVYLLSLIHISEPQFTAAQQRRAPGHQGDSEKPEDPLPAVQLCSGGEPLHTSQKAGKGGDHHGDQQEQKIGNAESWGDGCDHRQHGKFRLGRPGIVVQDKQNRRGHHEKHGTAQANSPWSAPWWDLPPQGGQDCHSAEHVIGRKCHSGGKPPNTALERRRRTGRQQEQGPRP